MIFGTAWIQFSSTVSQSAVVYVHRRCQRQSQNWASWIIFGSQGPRFRQRFMSQWQSMYIEDFSVRLKTGFGEYFWDNRDSVFVNVFSVSISLYVLQISASAVELGSLIFFGPQGCCFCQWFLSQQWSLSTEDFSVGRRTRFWSMIFGTTRTQFSSTVSQSAVV